MRNGKRVFQRKNMEERAMEERKKMKKILGLIIQRRFEWLWRRIHRWWGGGYYIF